MLSELIPLMLLVAAAASVAGGVDFPGVPPGPARADRQGEVLRLENDVIAASWRVAGGALRPVCLENKLTHERFDQNGREVFRIAMRPAEARPAPAGVAVTIRLGDDTVSASVSRDGVVWHELVSVPRLDFAGEPKLVRIGKMNSRGEAKSHSTNGSVGEGCITGLEPVPTSMPGGRFDFKATAHEAATAQYPYPKGATSIRCRIDKGTDQGLTWGPAIALVWEDGVRFFGIGVRSADSKNEHHPVFNVFVPDGERIMGVELDTYPPFDLPASSFRVTSVRFPLTLAAESNALPLSARSAGRAIEAEVVSAGGVTAVWRAVLRDGSGYIHEQVELRGAGAAVPLRGVELIDVGIPGMATVGRVPGCPVAGSGFFAGVELPGAGNAVSDAGARVQVACDLSVSPRQSYRFGAVVGVAPAGQLRRGFLHYVERERARPSAPFLHYNCWYDLGYGVSAKGVLDVVARFDQELVRRRGVPVVSYLVDDGWDDPGKGLWAANAAKFPEGLDGLKKRLDAYGAHLGIWISPLGGYGGAKERTEWARRMNLIPAGGELDLAQPAYKEWFRDRCLRLMHEDGVNAFKWDKAGEGVGPHFMALLVVARRLRRENPEVFINVTVGTWPSPFWLNHIDSTWRNGSADVGWAGKGDDPNGDEYNRERWLTFRDGYCHRLFVERSPLYPLNSVMHHGIVHGREFQGGTMGRSNPPDLKNEARSYFASGAMLQELYLTPLLMTDESWDQVAEAARWAHENADVLRDAHWVGGDPLKLEVYGYAAWSPRKGTLMLRNPNDCRQSIELDAVAVFELPAEAPRRYVLTAPYPDQRLQSVEITAGEAHPVALEPFEVLVFDARPAGRE